MKSVNLKNLVKEIRVPGAHAKAFEMRKGQFLAIVDVEVKQVADFIAFNKNNHHENLSPAHTRTSLLSLKFSVGDELRSNFRNPMFEIIEDTIGTHDLLFAACDERRYLVDYGVKEHRSCVANFEEVLESYGIQRTQFSEPFNIFMRIDIEPNGKPIQQPSPSGPGDYIMLQAKMDVIGALSACPMDLNPIGGDRITDIIIRIFN
jgi:uncharacterized protein YcgI (DUF1989 family)